MFPRALLLDLYRIGDAFTHGRGVDQPDLVGTNQLELDFANDPDPETAFPACDVCRSVIDLYLTITGSPHDLVAQLQCANCRALPAARLDTCIPVGLLSRSVLARLFQIKPVHKKAPNVSQFEQLLQAEFESKWAALSKASRPTQPTLLGGIPTNELNLGTYQASPPVQLAGAVATQFPTGASRRWRTGRRGSHRPRLLRPLEAGKMSGYQILGFDNFLRQAPP